MTAVAFHFGAPDKLAYVCRLLRKAASSGSKVLVVGQADILQQVDSELWAVAPTDFVAHCFDAAECFVQQRCSVVLGARALQPAFSAQVLLNLSDEVAPGFEAFERVIEVVSTDDADRERARRRWRNYSEQGYKITRHDLALKNSG